MLIYNAIDGKRPKALRSQCRDLSKRNVYFQMEKIQSHRTTEILKIFIIFSVLFFLRAYKRYGGSLTNETMPLSSFLSLEDFKIININKKVVGPSDKNALVPH